ncbi:phage baseplate protein [Candidatus Ruminimicrobiellum ovillum]|uniref:phage baseplate protein n=1 Tax=Candidatus Ruminimicrobiellum ovillum TaxID=1947927 RepID=UPI0035599A8B
MVKKILALLFLIFSSQIVFADVPNEIRYNGKLKEYRTEVNATKTMNFKIYSQPAGGTAKWESGNQSVVVSSGIFSVVLNPEIDWRQRDCYLEIEIENKKLEPREKLTSVPYSLHSNTTESATVKEDSEFSVTVGNDKKFVVDSSGAKTIVGTTEYFMVPKGAIIIWSGSINDIPAGWVLCDGTNGTPDLRDRFILGAGRNYAVDTTGGEESVALTINNIPAHSHKISIKNYSENGSYKIDENRVGSPGKDYENDVTWNTDTTINEQTAFEAHNNMPPYYALCYIMRIN